MADTLSQLILYSLSDHPASPSEATAGHHFKMETADVLQVNAIPGEITAACLQAVAAVNSAREGSPLGAVIGLSHAEVKEVDSALTATH